MKKGAFFSIFIWLVIVAASLFWNIKQSENQYNNLAFQSARSFFNQILVTREWSARHGGVFAPATKDTPPNPYLNVPLRDIRVSENLLLTKLNPSYITRQIAELSATKNGIQFHITSLKPIRPQNVATPWEKESLTAFENGLAERGQFFNQDNTSTFVYMAPLIAERPCLVCHSDYQEGDIRGGISVTLPLISTHKTLPIYFVHFLFSILGITGILIFWVILSKAYAKIHRQAVIDSLTGVANRRYFSERILEEFNRSRRKNEPLSVLMCDIDNFKGYNDNYGHTAGDKCLSLVAQTIKNSIRRSSDFCARYGGEEFVIILPETDNNGAIKVAKKVLGNIRKLAIKHNTSEPLKIITMSIGSATAFEKTLESHEELVKQADTALYLAKKNGKNRVESQQES